MSFLPCVQPPSIEKQPNLIVNFPAVGIVLVYCRPSRSILGKICCRVWDIRDQVHLGWIRNERVSRPLDVRDKKSDFGGLIYQFAAECAS